MRELYSKALVLERRDAGEVDGMIHLFTEDYGKVVAWAKSVKKNTSKLSAHLQPLTFIKVRFIQRPGPKDGFAIVDCMRDDEFADFSTSSRYDLLPVISFLNKGMFEFQPDRKLWTFLVHIFKKKYLYSDVVKTLLLIMGFDPEKSRCALCSAKDLAAFHKSDQIFLCGLCASKFPADKVLLLNTNN